MVDSIATSTATIVLDVTGMKCAGCVRNVEKQLLAQPGIESARVNLLAGVAAVDIGDRSVDPIELAAKLTAGGFPAQARLEGENAGADRAARRQERYQQEARELLWQLITAGVLLGLSAVGHLAQPTTHLHHGTALLETFWWHWGLATLAIAFPGRSILVDGCRSLLRGMPNMNSLVGLGIIASYTASVIALFLPTLGWECFFEEPVMIIGFITLGRALERQAKQRATQAFDRLLSLQPTVARLVSGDPDRPQPIEIPVERVQVGEYLQVLPGEKIPADGLIRWGETTIDESLVTGEAMPVLKRSGDAVIAGTIVQSGAISIEITRTGADTTLAQIIALVEAAQTRKAPVQQLADRVAGYFTYGILTIACITALVWYAIGTHQPLPSALVPLKTAIAVLVVACPCALGLATPTAILVGTGIGAESGLLIKGGDVLETAQDLDTIVFDKTGTLTVGKPQVVQISAPSGMDDRTLLALAAAAESVTNHPLATAIQQAASETGITIPVPTSARTEAGLGASAEVVIGEDLAFASGNYQVAVGNANWLAANDLAIDPTLQTTADAWSANGLTPIYVAVAPSDAPDDATIGLIGVSDCLREEAIETISRLQAMGINVVLLTGDREPVAAIVAEKLGISDVRAEVLPAQKASVIKSLQNKSARVAMVGDGINDAPALAQADVGIALNAGTDVAIEVADIILMRDRLADVVRAIELSQATIVKIRQNLVWAVIYNVLSVPAAAGLFYWLGWGNFLEPATAGVLMAFSSVSVVVNSLLLNLGR